MVDYESNERQRRRIVRAAWLIGLSTAVLAVFFIATIRQNVDRLTPRIGRRGLPDAEALAQISDVQDYLQAMGKYEILVTGLVDTDLTTSLAELIERYETSIETVEVTGTRTDGEKIDSTVTGIPLSAVFSDLGVSPGVRNVTFYATDLYAAVVPLPAVRDGSVFLVWHDELRLYVSPHHLRRWKHKRLGETARRDRAHRRVRRYRSRP